MSFSSWIIEKLSSFEFPQHSPHLDWHSRQNNFQQFSQKSRKASSIEIKNFLGSIIFNFHIYFLFNLARMEIERKVSSHLLFSYFFSLHVPCYSEIQNFSLDSHLSNPPHTSYKWQKNNTQYVLNRKEERAGSEENMIIVRGFKLYCEIKSSCHRK